MSSQSPDQNEDEHDYRIRTDPRFFHQTLSTIPEPMSQILETYSGIPRSQQIEHVVRVRERAWKSKPYPCLGRFRFLELDLSSFPLYNEYVLPRLKQQTRASEKEAIFLDLGTCLGQDLRKLIFDGVAPSKLYGADIEPEYIKYGYELFQDVDKIPKDHIIYPANVLDTSVDDKLSVLDDCVDILHISAVFHLFDLENQRQIARRCLRLLRKRPQDKSLILGGQVGNINPRDSIRPSGDKRYRHDEATWRSMWEEVCAEQEWRDKVKKVEVQATLQERSLHSGNPTEKPKVIGSAEEGFRWMIWSVWIEFH